MFITGLDVHDSAMLLHNAYIAPGTFTVADIAAKKLLRVARFRVHFIKNVTLIFVFSEHTTIEKIPQLYLNQFCLKIEK